MASRRMPEPGEIRFVERGEVRLATQDFGNPTNDASVLIMGATASMVWWPEALCSQLASLGLHVIRYDNRDTGQSTCVPPGEAAYAVEDMAGDLFAVMDAYGIGSAHLMGMSLGGYIAQIAALKAPERVRSLILFASEPLGWTGDPLPGIDDRFMEHFAGFGELDWSDRDAVARFLLEIARLSAGSRHPFDADAALARINEEIDRTHSMASAFNHGALTTRENCSGRLAEITQQVLVIHGSNDPILPLPNGEALVEAIPKAELKVLPGVGHELVPAEFPVMVEAIRAFLERANRAG
jgi:pimeloyl-ACP methyl ester carboxylesterase